MSKNTIILKSQHKHKIKSDLMLKLIIKIKFIYERFNIMYQRSYNTK